MIIGKLAENRKQLRETLPIVDSRDRVAGSWDYDAPVISFLKGAGFRGPPNVHHIVAA